MVIFAVDCSNLNKVECKFYFYYYFSISCFGGSNLNKVECK